MRRNVAIPILVFNLFAGLTAQAATVTYPVFARNDKHELGDLPEPRELEDLKEANESACPDVKFPCLSGKYFKIVYGKSEVPVSLDGSADSYRAASVYFNFTNARKYWLKALGEDGLKHLGLVIGRLNIVNNFNEQGRYTHENNGTRFNDATSIPPSDQERDPTLSPEWGYEMWFHPPMEISEKTALAAFDEASKNEAMKEQLRVGIISNSLSRYAQISSAYQTIIDPLFYLKQIGLNLAIAEGVPKALGLLGRSIKQKTFLDTATIPEVVYHEYTHMVLNKELGIGESTPVVEGVANYYAIMMLGYPKLLDKMGAHGKQSHTMSGLGRDHYSFLAEGKSKYSWENFTIQILYHLGEEFGQDRMQKAVLIAVHQMATLTLGDLSKANIRTDLMDAIHSALVVLSPPSEQYNVIYRMNKALDGMAL